MLVTVFSDASWCPDTQVGGWGAWAKSARGTVQASGAFRMPVETVCTAEVRAACNALHMVLRSALYVPGDSLLVQIDSEEALFALRRTPRPRLVAVKAGVDRFFELAEQGDVAGIEFRWIKGHGWDGTSRSWAHNRSDELARKAMRAARAAVVAVRQTSL